MQTEQMILAHEFCTHHNIDFTFITSLKDSGLIEVTVVEEKLCIPESQLPFLEKLTRLRYEMDINLEGIETITCLLEKIHEMRQHIQMLNNRLSLYEDR